MKTTAIQVTNLTKQFKTDVALAGISFQVQAGEIFGLLGPSGAGKTTTIKILTGQLAPTNGLAEVLGQPVTNLTEKSYAQIGIVTHQSGLYDRLTVNQNLNYFAQLYQLKPARVTTVLKQVGLEADRNKRASKLSQGMRQRLILARAILHQPKVLFLDEPTSGLDPMTTQAIHGLIRDLQAHGTAILLTTHNMAEATALCDQVALLNNGHFAELGTPQALRFKYNRQIAFNIQLKMQPTAITLTAGPQTTAKINHWLTEQTLLSIHSCEPTLEDVFLTVTGRNLQ